MRDIANNMSKKILMTETEIRDLIIDEVGYDNYLKLEMKSDWSLGSILQKAKSAIGTAKKFWTKKYEKASELSIDSGPGDQEVGEKFSRSYSKVIDGLKEKGESVDDILNSGWTGAFTFPVAGDCFNVGYDHYGLSNRHKTSPSNPRKQYDKRAPKILHKRYAIHDNGWSQKHKGVDIFAPEGSPLVACVTGVVTKKGSGGKGGNNFTITRGPTNKPENFYYAHLQEPASVNVGDKVKRGQSVGKLGKTGSASNTFPHLHFTWYGPKGYFNQNLDSWKYLSKVLQGLPHVKSSESGYKPNITAKDIGVSVSKCPDKKMSESFESVNDIILEHIRCYNE